VKIKFLVIRFSSIGDIVLTTPVVRCLKQQVEHAEVHFVTKEKHSSILSSNPYIEKVHILDENIAGLIAELEKEEFDYIIDLHQNFRSNRIKRRLDIPAFSYKKLNLEKFLLVHFKISRLPKKHIVDRYLETLSVFDVENDGNGLDYFIPEPENYDLKKLPESFQKGFAAFVIAGTYTTKKLTEKKIIEICNNAGVPVVLLGGKCEMEAASRVLEKVTGEILDLTGKLSLNQSASLVKAANVVLTNDTGLMHIAAAFKKKILSFWGNTVPEFGMTPYQPHPISKIMAVENLKCRPCSKLGYEKCPKKHFKCMNEINVQEAVSWIKQNF
jgi:ADP-heptose:LPS heptosyltransferase